MTSVQITVQRLSGKIVGTAVWSIVRNAYAHEQLLQEREGYIRLSVRFTFLSASVRFLLVCSQFG